MIFPPATSSVTPVIHEEAEEARKSEAEATSSGCPRRPRGNAAARAFLSSSETQVRILSFSIADGARQLTRMPSLANSLARWRVNPMTPAFAAAYAAEDLAG